MLCADYQGQNPNALVSSGLAPFFKPRRGEPCLGPRHYIVFLRSLGRSITAGTVLYRRALYNSCDSNRSLTLFVISDLQLLSKKIFLDYSMIVAATAYPAYAVFRIH